MTVTAEANGQPPPPPLPAGPPAVEQPPAVPQPKPPLLPVDQITARARQVTFGKAVLTVIAAVLYGSAYLAAKVFSVAWLGLAWCAAAVALGWHTARGKGPTRSALLDENAALREQLRRMGG